MLKRALIHGGLKRGLREVAKALDSRTAKLCCLAKDCDNAEYSNLVRALCDEGGVSLVMVDEGKQLGEWAGLCKINEEGEATSVVRCSAACVTEFGEDTRALRAADVPQGPGARGQSESVERRSTIGEGRAPLRKGVTHHARVPRARKPDGRRRGQRRARDGSDQATLTRSSRNASRSPMNALVPPVLSGLVVREEREPVLEVDAVDVPQKLVRERALRRLPVGVDGRVELGEGRVAHVRPTSDDDGRTAPSGRRG